MSPATGELPAPYGVWLKSKIHGQACMNKNKTGAGAYDLAAPAPYTNKAMSRNNKLTFMGSSVSVSVVVAILTLKTLPPVKQPETEERIQKISFDTERGEGHWKRVHPDSIRSLVWVPDNK
jgi:hypothetical protein